MFASIPPQVLFWLKLITFSITSLLALLGLLYDFKDKATQKLTRWGRINLCGLVVAFVVGIASQKVEDDQKNASATHDAGVMKALVDGNQKLVTDDESALKSLAQVVASNSSLLTSSQQTLQSQQSLLASESKLNEQVLRGNYPLEPMTLSYEKVYTMNQPGLSEYAARVQKDIYQYQVEKLEGRRVVKEDLSDEPFGFVLNNPGSAWNPGNGAQERYVAEALLEDNVGFIFSNPRKEEEIQLLSIPLSLSEIIVKLPTKGSLKQTIQLAADFKRRVFIKTVTCENPARTGSPIPFSALDLVGRTMTWKPVESGALNPVWSLESFAIRFSFENDGDRLRRSFTIPANQHSLVMTSKMLGLDSIMQAVESDPITMSNKKQKQR